MVSLSIATRLASAFLFIDNGKKVKGELVHGERRRPLPGVDAGPRPTDQPPVYRTFEVPSVRTADGLLDADRRYVRRGGVGGRSTAPDICYRLGSRSLYSPPLAAGPS